MTDKTNFTPDEWKLIMEGVMAAGIAVTAAEPSGLIGLLKEGFASSSALVQAKMNPGTSALVKAVVADFETSEGRTAARDGLKQKLSGATTAQMKDRCIDTLRQAGALLDSKAPADAQAFKSWMRETSQHVAEAASEGGLFGVGGVKVSEAEKATLADISSALKLAA